MEQEIYAVGNQLVDHDPGASRATRLQWLRSLSGALYGSGLLSERQRRRLTSASSGSNRTPESRARPITTTALRYLARVPQWAQQAMEFQFGLTVQTLVGADALACPFRA